MSIEDLIVKVTEAEKRRTPKQSQELLVKAKILDENGNYDINFFRKETVERSRKKRINS